MACREHEFVLYRGYFEIKVYCILKMGYSFHRDWFMVFYDEFMAVFGATWLLVML